MNKTKIDLSYVPMFRNSIKINTKSIDCQAYNRKTKVKYTFGKVESTIISHIDGINSIEDIIEAQSEADDKFIINFMEYLIEKDIIVDSNLTPLRIKIKETYKFLQHILEKFCFIFILLVFVIGIFSIMYFCINRSAIIRLINNIGNLNIKLKLSLFFEVAIFIYFHEISHAIFAKLKGCSIWDMGIHFWSGGFTYISGIQNLKETDQILLYAAGILCNLICIPLSLVGITFDNVVIQQHCFEYVIINILLIFFNLIPYNNTDGKIIKKLIVKKLARFSLLKKIVNVLYYFLFICIGIISIILIKKYCA